LTKKYGRFTAVDKLNLTIESGESYGFLGPNGAGKTTTLLMLLGILLPTSGEVKIKGDPVRSDSFALKKNIGVVAEYQTFYENMTAWEYVMFFAQLYQVSDSEKRAEELFDHLKLEKWKNTLISAYSTGMKKKLGFIRALIHSPELLILDEPVSGLDPFGIIQVRSLLMAEKARGATLIISSHILSEVEQTADRVGIISRGKLILEDSMDKIRHRVGDGEKIHLKFANLPPEKFERFLSLPFVTQATRDGNLVTLLTKEDADYSEDIGKFILDQQLITLEMKKSETTLEEAYVTISEQSLKSIHEGLAMQEGDRE
jgi:ABC-2 type transport system ATP-binding protein